MNALHSHDTPEWYTPAEYVDAAREVMGGIDLDPASHAEANITVGAKEYYTEQDNGLVKPWYGRVFVNPPGGLVNEFWKKLVEEYSFNLALTQAIWIGYSMEQLQTIQSISTTHPLEYPFCIPKQRIAFIENAAKHEERVKKLIALGKKPSAKSSPSHGNYIVYMGDNVQKFQAVFSQFGKVRI